MTDFVLFSGIDGTLVGADDKSQAATETAVSLVLSRRVPLILCAPQTRSEQEHYRRALDIPDPFIVENGGAIFVPDSYFDFDFSCRPDAAGYCVIELGRPAAEIREALKTIRRETGLFFQTFGDVTVRQVSEILGVDVTAARRARSREYSEMIVTPLTADILDQLRNALAPHGLQIVAVGDCHIVSAATTDLGAAVASLIQLYRRRWGEVVTIGLGDSIQDRPLLAAVDRPYLVQTAAGRWQDVGGLDVYHADGIGPIGWRQAVQQELGLAA
jgi:mannosyl-3-phosphoglycerate phosphatase